MVTTPFEARRTSSTAEGRRPLRGTSTSAIASGLPRTRRRPRAVSVSGEAERADGRLRRATNTASKASVSTHASKSSSPNRTDELTVYLHRDVPYSRVQAKAARSHLIKLLAAQLVREALAPKTNVNRLSDGFRHSCARRPVRQIQLRLIAPPWWWRWQLMLQ